MQDLSRDRVFIMRLTRSNVIAGGRILTTPPPKKRGTMWNRIILALECDGIRQWLRLPNFREFHEGVVVAVEGNAVFFQYQEYAGILADVCGICDGATLEPYREGK